MRIFWSQKTKSTDPASYAQIIWHVINNQYLRPAGLTGCSLAVGRGGSALPVGGSSEDRFLLLSSAYSSLVAVGGRGRFWDVLERESWGLGPFLCFARRACWSFCSFSMAAFAVVDVFAVVLERAHPPCSFCGVGDGGWWWYFTKAGLNLDIVFPSVLCQVAVPTHDRISLAHFHHMLSGITVVTGHRLTRIFKAEF